MVSRSAGRHQRPDDRGIPITRIPGLVSCEFFSRDETVAMMLEQTKPSYSHDEIFGQWQHLGLHIDCDVQDAFDYAANVYSLEEWTTSIRNFEPVEGTGNVYRGFDKWGGDPDSVDEWGGGATSNYVRIESHRETGCVDILSAWDQWDELFLRIHLRFLDAQAAMGRPGTMMLWSMFKHPYYEGGPDAPPHIREAIARPGRMWVGEFWKVFPAGHAIEANNMKLILEHRAKA